jgi:tetratricopeptide (TPR) repeat protein
MVTRKALLAAIIVLFAPAILAEQKPDSLETHYQLAQQAQKRGDYAAAADEWKAIVALSPKLAEAHANLGMMYQLLNRQKDAIESFETALRLNPNLSSVRLFLGIEYYLTSRPDLAITQLREAVRLEPREAVAQKWLGLSYLYAGDSARAIPELRSYHLHNPNDDNITFNLDRAYFRLSMDAFRSVATTHSDSPWDHLIRGEQCALQEAYPEALAEFQRGLAGEAESDAVHFRRGEVFETEGKVASAIDEYGDELLERPQHLESIVHLYRLFRNLGLASEADTLFTSARAALRRHPKSLSAIERLHAEEPSTAPTDASVRADALARARTLLDKYAARIRAQSAKPAEWTEEVRSALDAEDSESALRLLGSPPPGTDKDQIQKWKALAEMARGNLNDALDILQQLAIKAPHNPEYSYYLGQCAEKLAMSTLQEFVKTSPDSYRTYQLQGEYWVAQRNFPKAVAAYKKALELSPGASQIHLALGWIYLNQDHRDDAISELKTELKSDPYSVPALVGMGEVYYKEGQPDRAKSYLLQAISINPNSPQAQMWLGKVSVDEGSFSEGVEHLQAALKNGVYDRGAVYFQLSRALKQLGRTEEANHYLALYKDSKAEENRRAHLPSEDAEVFHLAPSKD